MGFRVGLTMINNFKMRHHVAEGIICSFVVSFSLLYSAPLIQFPQDLLLVITSQSLLLNARHLRQLLCHVALLQLVSL